MRSTNLSRRGTIVIAVAFLMAAAYSAISSEIASAGSWDREVTDSVGRTAFSNVDQTMDGDFVYWSYPVGGRPFNKGMVWELRQLTISTGMIRKIARVRNGMFGSVKANAGQLAFSTHRRVRSRRGGKLVTTESVLYKMAATDAVPTELRRDTAVSRFSLTRRGKRVRTELDAICGELPSIADVSDTGRTLAFLRTIQCVGADETANYLSAFTYDPGTTAAVDIGPIGDKLQVAIRRGKLIDLGDWNPGDADRRASIRDLASGAIARLPFRGDYSYELIAGDHGRFAFMTDESRASNEALNFARIYSLDTAQLILKLRVHPEREITSLIFCSDGLVQVKESVRTSRTTLIFRDSSGKTVGTRRGPRGNSHFMTGKCDARTLTAAIMEFDRRGKSAVKIRRYEF